MKHMSRQLMHLVAVIDHGSLSGAAETLKLTQSALTRSISGLEAEIGNKVLERGRHGATPTKFGETLYIHGKNIITSLDRASDDVQALHQHDSGKLFIGSTSLPAVHFVPRAISLFLKKHPRIGLRFEVFSANEMHAMLRQGAIDFFVGSRDIERLPAGIESTKLRDEHLSIICGPQHPLLKMKQHDFTDYADYPWLLPTKDAALRQQAEAIFQEMGVTDIDIAIETIATASLMSLLNDENYLTLHSGYLLSPDIQAGRLIELRKDVAGSRRALTAFHRDTDEMTDLVRVFIDHLKECAHSPII